MVLSPQGTIFYSCSYSGSHNLSLMWQSQVTAFGPMRFSLVVACFAIFARQIKADQPPHLILLLADDVGYNSVGFNGQNPESVTPHIDRLAAGGTVFTNFHAYFWCSPSRASLMSGRLPHHIYQNQNSVMCPDQGLPLSMTTLASKLQAVGYKTVHAGKWDLGFGRPQYLPVNRGFNSSFGFLTGAEDHFSQHICQDGLCLSEDPKGPYSDMWQQADPAYHLNNSGIFGDTVWTSSAIGAIHSLTDGQPLFLYLAFAAAHTPLQAPEESLKLFSESIYKDRRVYAAQMHALDSNVGRVVVALEEKQMWANSLVVFLSDNGGPLYWNNENISGIRWHGGAGSNNYPLRGGKLSVLEGGMRVPFVMAGGALSTRQSSDGQRNHALTSIADVFATFCVAAGVPVTHDSTSPLLPPVDGVDLMPLLTEENVTAVRTSLTLALGVSREVMGGEGTMSAIIEGDLKLVIGSTNFWFDTAPLWPDEDYPWVWGHDTVLHCGVEGCLFNLTADPGETTNIAATRPKDVSRLAILLSQDFMYEADPGPEEPHLFLAAIDARGGFIGPFAKDVQSQHDLQ